MTIDPRMLDPGETLIWSGRTMPLAYALRKSWSTFLFGIFFFSFAVFWTSEVAGQGGQTEIPVWLFGIPFVLVGAGMLISPLWHLWRGVHTTYVLTSKRALIAIAGPFARRFSVPLEQIRFVDTRPIAGGAGSILFKETATRDGEGGTTISREGFVAITDVDRVDRLLRQVIERTTVAS
jgi:hypothetical protein